MPRAAGRQGLYRIVYALFYLWHLSREHAAFLGDIPEAHRIRIFLLAPLPGWPSGAALGLLESALVAALVLLLFGLWTRASTAAVLVLGLLLEAFFFSVDQEHATTMLVFYVPLFMVLGGAWGDTYSVDARRRGGAAVDPAGSAQPYVLPMRTVLVLLCGLIFSSAVFKMVGGGTWLSDRDVLSYLFVHKDIEAAREGLLGNPLAPLIGRTPSLGWALQLATLALELAFPLALVGERVRHVLLASILVFHSVNALWMATTFTAFLVVYGLFVDWEWLRRRLAPRPVLRRFGAAPPARLAGGVVALAVAAGALWNAGGALRAALNVGGVLDWQTIWIPVLPLSAGWLVVSVARLVRDGAARVRRPHPARQ